MAQRLFFKEKSLYWPPSGGSPGEKSRLHTLRVSEYPKCQQNLNININKINGVHVTPFCFGLLPKTPSGLARKNTIMVFLGFFKGV